MPATADMIKSNYLGSKRRLAKYIAGKFPADGGTIADPMCGISAVLVEAARRGYTVRGNDLSIVPYWYSKGIFEGTQLADDDVEKLAGAAPRDGWLTTEWKGKYPRPKEVRRFLDGLAARARAWKGAKGWAARAVASTALQTVYSESGSGYSTIRYESVAKIADTVRRAAREVNKLVSAVGGKGTITNVDARSFTFPKSDVAYFDPPYFKRDKGAVQYFQSYKIPNSILLGKEWKADNLRPEQIPALVERLCKSARHVFVSTSSNEVVPYAKELSRHKKTMKRFRVSYRQTSGFGSRDAEQHQHLYVAKAEPPDVAAPAATAAPAEDGEYRYVIQEHFRGRSVHADLRMETGRAKLEAWTLSTQTAGSVAEPVTTLDQARDAGRHSKVDWESGELLAPVAAVPKPPCDPSWLTYEGVIAAGETGALEDGPGVVRIIDRGHCEYGARRPDLREYFLASDAATGGVTGRAVFSQLQDSPDGLWLFALPEDKTPYVLSRGAVANAWVPAQGVSALPAALRSEIPEERRFWTLEGEAERRTARDALVAALVAGELELSYLAKSEEKAEPEINKSGEPTLPVTFECALDIAKAYEDDGRWIVEGYAATSDFDLQDDIISEQAIRDSAKDLLENSTVLHNHSPDEAIGRVLDSKASAEGLFLKIMISKTAPEKWQQIKEGVLNKFSVRGKVLDAGKQWMPALKRHARVIHRMQLVEVSLVAVPANPKARAIRWYVEKALDEFEKAGGLLESGAEGTSGGCHVNEEDREAEGDVQEELIEAKGEGDAPSFAEEPKPSEAPSGNEGEADASALIAKLLEGEQDPARRAVLEKIRDAVVKPAAKPAEAPKGDDDVAKAGRKMSAARIQRLKRLLEELKGLIVEVDGADAAKDVHKADAAPADSGTDEVIVRIARALGIEPSKPGEVPNIAKAVEELTKRLDSLEETPAGKTSLDESDEASGKQERKVWKGLL